MVGESVVVLFFSKSSLSSVSSRRRLRAVIRADDSFSSPVTSSLNCGADVDHALVSSSRCASTCGDVIFFISPSGDKAAGSFKRCAETGKHESVAMQHKCFSSAYHQLPPSFFKLRNKASANNTRVITPSRSGHHFSEFCCCRKLVRFFATENTAAMNQVNMSPSTPDTSQMPRNGKAIQHTKAVKP